MSLRIDPKVAFAFKLMLGSREHPRITIHFLNSVLQPRQPITSVEILNPIQERDRSDAKLAILDDLAFHPLELPKYRVPSDNELSQECSA